MDLHPLERYVRSLCPSIISAAAILGLTKYLHNNHYQLGSFSLFRLKMG